jgi:ubiquinone biosynthesis protein
VRYLGGALGMWYLTERRLGGSKKTAGISRRLRIAAEHLGPTYIKLGQIVASGDGIFPPELVAEFKWCRDQVPAEPWSVVEEVLHQELGRPPSEVFASIDHIPLAAASIAQVHRAELLDGTEVVIKVQRPSVIRRVHQDLAVMAWLAPHLVGRIPIAALANPPALVELFAETIVEELDFRLEAENMLDIASTFAELGQRDFVVPRPHPTLVTRRMLVMERLNGFNFSDVAGMRAAGIDTDAVVRSGMIGFLEGAMMYGIFHGDLHAGNLFILPSGKIALLDFGITARLSESKRLALLSLIVGASNGHIPSQVAAMRDLGALPENTDIDTVIAQLGLDRPPVDPTTLTPDELVAELQRSIKTLLALGARMPKELMLFVKNLVFLDGAIATLAPDLDLFGEIEAISYMFAEKHGERIMCQLGLVRQDDWKLDLSSVKAGFGLDDTTQRLTHREIQARRAQVRETYEGRVNDRRPRKRRRRATQ